MIGLETRANFLNLLGPDALIPRNFDSFRDLLTMSNKGIERMVDVHV